VKGWILAIGALIVWHVLGDPKNDVANVFWKAGPAPWEKVDAFYYPDRSRLSRFEQKLELDSLDSCRSWVQSRANANDDRRLIRGDYECAIGFMRRSGDLRVYRLTIR